MPDPLGSTNPANGLIIICKTSDDWKKLLERMASSRRKGDNEVAEYLTDYAEAVDSLEKKASFNEVTRELVWGFVMLIPFLSAHLSPNV